MQAGGVQRWLWQSKGIAVQDDWLGACVEWVLSEEVYTARVYALRKGLGTRLANLFMHILFTPPFSGGKRFAEEPARACV